MNSPRVYGWIRDEKDHRDFQYRDILPTAQVKLPSFVDLRKQAPPVYDQGQLGSCTANAIAGAVQMCQTKEKYASPYMPSRLFIYFNEREMEGTINEDAGAMIRDGMKSLASKGACHETLWLYDISKFAMRPPTNAYADAVKHEATNYYSVRQSLYDLKHCLYEGYPFVLGISIYENFESSVEASKGTVAMPQGKLEGGHAVCCVGYNDKLKCFIIRNSWGAAWGIKGYFLLPYAYVTNSELASDFWTLRLIN